MDDEEIYTQQRWIKGNFYLLRYVSIRSEILDKSNFTTLSTPLIHLIIGSYNNFIY